MRIDAHVHVLQRGSWPDAWFDWVSRKWAASKRPPADPEAIRDKIEDGLIDPDGGRLISAMDASGVDVSVLIGIDWGPEYPDRLPIRQAHEQLAATASRHAGRLVPFAALDPRRAHAPDTLEWAVRTLGMRGLKLYPPAGFYPDDRVAYPLYEACAAFDIPVVFHTGEALPISLTMYAQPLRIQAVQRDFPGLTIWLAHAGAPLWWDEAALVCRTSINTYLELSAWVWDTTTEEEGDQFVRRLARARDQLGIERLLFASDHLSGHRVRGPNFLPHVISWYEGLQQRAARLGLHFSDAEVDAVMGDNAARLLRLQTSGAHRRPGPE